MNHSKAQQYLDQAGLEGDLEEVQAGNVSETYKVGDQYYLQVSDINPENLRRGMLELQSQQETDIPVPEIVYSDLEEPVLITEAVEGQSIGSTQDEEIYRQAGRIMADIHDNNFENYGLMRVEGDQLRPSGSQNWQNSFSKLYHRFMHSGSQLLDQKKAADIDRFFYDKSTELVEDPEKSMAHFDFNQDNLLYSDGEITGVLDWDMLRVIDPALEVIRAQHQFEREGKPADAFVEGYKSKRGLEINPETEKLYRLTAELGRLSELEFLQRTQDIEPQERDLEQTVNNIDQIMEPV